MDFSTIDLSPDDEALLGEARRFFSEHWQHDRSVIANDHERIPADLRLAMARRGWIRPRAPREEGGAGLDAVQARLLDEAQAELGVPGTGGSELFAPSLARYASDRVKREVLPRLLSGEATICIGYSEPDSGSDVAAARTRAVRDGDHWVITGQKMFTTWGHESDYVFLLARTGPVELKHASLTVFLVPMDTPGVEAAPVWVLGGGRTNVTYYTDVRVHDDFRLGPVDAGWEVVSQPLAAEHGVGSESEGVAPINGEMGVMFSRTLGKLIEFAVEWAVSRGRLQEPQVRRTLAEALLDLEVCWNAPGESGKPLSAAALIRNADRLGDMAAPESVLDRGYGGSIAAGVIAQARMHAPGADIYGGTSEIYRNNIARGLGLPRPY